MASPRKPTTMEKLPDEVLSDIFIRLLAKQLAQMRCICKSWNALLSDSSFVKSHLHRSIHHYDDSLLFFQREFSLESSSFAARPYHSPNLELTNFIKLSVNPQLMYTRSLDIDKLKDDLSSVGLLNLEIASPYVIAGLSTGIQLLENLKSNSSDKVGDSESVSARTKVYTYSETSSTSVSDDSVEIVQHPQPSNSEKL